MQSSNQHTEVSENTDCRLCRKITDMVIENDLTYALYDTFPVSPGHCLIVPKRHVAEYFDATAEEKKAIWDMVDAMKVIIDKDYQPDGYNIGINVGKSAGQSIPHIHIHMIPRYAGDMDDPRGGVRGVIPAKQKYAKQPSLDES